MSAREKAHQASKIFNVVSECLSHLSNNLSSFRARNLKEKQVESVILTHTHKQDLGRNI